MIHWLDSPLHSQSSLYRLRFPWLGCTIGAPYPDVGTYIAILYRVPAAASAHHLFYLCIEGDIFCGKKSIKIQNLLSTTHEMMSKLQFSQKVVSLNKGIVSKGKKKKKHCTGFGNWTLVRVLPNEVPGRATLTTKLELVRQEGSLLACSILYKVEEPPAHHRCLEKTRLLVCVPKLARQLIQSTRTFLPLVSTLSSDIFASSPITQP